MFKPKLAVVGSGISGLAVAYRMAQHAHVTLFEAGSYFGGHTHTVDVTLQGPKNDAITHGVDTGFLVYNHLTYPNLIRLFAELQVETAASEMSFSVQVPATPQHGALEWSGNNLSSVFSQRRNLANPRFLRMLADVLRFNRLTTALASRNAEAELLEPIGDFLKRNGFGSAFCDWYFLPMIGCIWSCPTDQMLRFPVATLVRFCHNHGLLQITNRPQWHTVRGGAKHYVAKLLAPLQDTRLNTPVRSLRRLPTGGVQLVTDSTSECFDDVVLACHSDQSLALLADASAAERRVLGAVRYHPNTAVLHTDAALLPKAPRAWAAWNYARAVHSTHEQAGVCLHYLINRLQPLPWQQPVVVSLNPDPARPPKPSTVLGEYHYSHPVFDAAAVQAQAQLPALQGQGGVWFCGAWARYGFHEDGLTSGLAVVDGLHAAHKVRYAADGDAARQQQRYAMAAA